MVDEKLGSEPPARAAFLALWQSRYPETLPIGWHFKHNYLDRWERIHSLPESKRRADTPEEWECLLFRQNTVIDSLVEQGTAIRIVFNSIPKKSGLFRDYHLQSLGIIQEDEDETAYESFLLETTWKSHSLDPFLESCANWEILAFIIAPDCLIYPYEGGMDIILKDKWSCEAFAVVYDRWLAPENKAT